jgi:hypothetical protein
MKWTKGRGRLGMFSPLLGSWKTEADSEMGKVTATRTFRKMLDGKYIELTAHWEYQGGSYDEIAMIGINREKQVCFWSFTSDGKQSQGELADVSDLHPEAFGFEAQMPAGLGRMAYWPDEQEGFHWVVEAQTKKGWRRIVEHHYRAAEE